MFRSIVVRGMQVGALFGGLLILLFDDGDELKGTFILAGLLSFLVVMALEWLRLNRAIEALTGVLVRAAEPIPPRLESMTRGLGFVLTTALMACVVFCAGLIRNWTEVIAIGAETPEAFIAGIFIVVAILAGLLAVYTALLLRLLLGAWTLRRFMHATKHLAGYPRPSFPTPIPGLVALTASPLAMLFWFDYNPVKSGLESGNTVLVFELGPDDSISELDSQLVELSPKRVHDFIPNDPSGLNQQYTLSVSASDKTTALGLLNSDSENVEWAESASMAQTPHAQRAGDCRAYGQGFSPTNDPYAKHQHSLYRTEILGLMDRTPWSTRKPTIVAVVDQGIDGSHPDLDGVVKSWGSSSAHGTAVAGVLAAKSKNRVGITSSNLNGDRIELLDFAINTDGRASSYQIADAVREAIDEGAAVINLSLSGTGSEPNVVSEALDYAEFRGVLVVAAAGNASSTLHWPARHGTVLSVASTDAGGRSSAFNGSNADLRAPGQEVCTTLEGGGYGTQTGTSLAAPYVSGIAASLLYLCPKASPATLRAALTTSASAGEVRANKAYALLAVQGQCSSF
ncbi:MAG: hypothetical protein ACI9VR_000363 [Cognaticolwellia sp.]|jgi:hypothetical protein